MFGLDRWDCPEVLVEDFIEDTGTTYTILMNAYNTGLLYDDSMRYWVINPDGIVAYRSGYHELNVPVKQEIIESLLLTLDVDEPTPVVQPEEFKLSNAYPNPFNPTATISLNLPQTATLTVTVYDILGRNVASLVNGRLNAGTHSFVLDGSSWASGVYFVRANASGLGVATQKVVLMK